MKVYPWGETKPSQTTYNLPDTASVDGRSLLFREQGRPPVPNAEAHDYAALVGSSLTPSATDVTGAHRGPQGAVICPASGASAPTQPDRCDDTAYGKGAGGRLTYRLERPRRRPHGLVLRRRLRRRRRRGPQRAERAPCATRPPCSAPSAPQRAAVQRHTRVILPGDRLLQQSVTWSKQNLADSVQEARAPAGPGHQRRHDVPRPRRHRVPGPLDRRRLAGLPVAVRDRRRVHRLRGRRQRPVRRDRGPPAGAARRQPRRQRHAAARWSTRSPRTARSTSARTATRATPTRPRSSRAWSPWCGAGPATTGSATTCTPSRCSNMRYIFRELDADKDGWPEGLGNVERSGMGEEKLDNAVYTIRGLRDLADLAASKGDTATRRWATGKAAGLEARFDKTWWFGPSAQQYADSLDDPGNKQVFQRHWIGVTPAEAEITRPGRSPARSPRRRTRGRWSRSASRPATRAPTGCSTPAPVRRPPPTATPARPATRPPPRSRPSGRCSR